MKRYFCLFEFCILLLIMNLLYAQEFEVPKDYKLDKKEDYAKYEGDVLKCIDYLEKIPSNDNSEKTKNANAFLLKWISGSPTVNINLCPYVTDLSEKNKSFLMIFMGGWTKYSIENPKDKDKVNGNLAGLESIIKVYQNAEGVKKDKKVEKIIKLKEESKLRDWVEKQIKDNKE